jgi:single-stranded DNA-binding protein
MSFNITNRAAELTMKGRAGDDAQFSAEHEVANVRFAVSRSWPNQNWKEGDDPKEKFASKTAWFKAAAWKGNANAAAQVKKGDVVEVEFHAADLVAEAYSKSDGTPGASLKIERCRITVISAKNGSSAPVEFEAEAVEETADIVL